MTYQEAFAHLDAHKTLIVTCPDGIDRVLWGYNGTTGDLCVAGWEGDVWMDCSDGTLKAHFAK